MSYAVNAITEIFEKEPKMDEENEERHELGLVGFHVAHHVHAPPRLTTHNLDTRPDTDAPNELSQAAHLGRRRS